MARTQIPGQLDFFGNETPPRRKRRTSSTGRSDAHQLRQRILDKLNQRGALSTAELTALLVDQVEADVRNAIKTLTRNGQVKNAGKQKMLAGTYVTLWGATAGEREAR